MNMDDCEAIFEKALSSSTEAEFCHRIEPLFSEYKILSLGLGRGSIFWRARIIENKPFKNLSELIYPPSQFARLGRLNDQGVPCFYVSTREETAIVEIGAEQGQRVQLGGFRIFDDSTVQLAVIGEYSNVHKSGYMHFSGCDPGLTVTKMLNAMPRHEALTRIYIDKFFAHVLADTNASSNRYCFSRALGQAIYQRNKSEGIVFPSVRDRGGFNIAIKTAIADKSFHNICCLVAEVIRIRRFGLVEFRVIKSAEKLDDDSNFVWRRENAPGVVGVYGMNKEEYDIASGDTSDRNSMLNMLRRGRV